MSSPENKERTARPVSVSNFADYFNRFQQSEENKCQATTTDKETILEVKLLICCEFGSFRLTN
jgi:hypothetical protein